VLTHREGKGRTTIQSPGRDAFADDGRGNAASANDRYGLSTDGVVAKVMEEFGDRPKQSAEPRDAGEEEPPWPREPEPPSA
jgi:hypothetical protein